MRRRRRTCQKGSGRPDLDLIDHALPVCHRGIDFLALLAECCFREFGRGRAGMTARLPGCRCLLQVLRPGPREAAHCRLARVAGAWPPGAPVVAGVALDPVLMIEPFFGHQRRRLLDR